MSRRAKPKLSVERANELIAKVNSSDRKDAHAAIAGGVRAAEEQWLDARFIAEALALQIVSIAERTGEGPAIARQLRAMADAIEARDEMRTQAEIH